MFMRFMINGCEVQMVRLELNTKGESGGGSTGGHILQLLIPHNPGKGRARYATFNCIGVHLQYNPLLKGAAVMSNIEPNEAGFMEIRILCGLELTVLMALMIAGQSVVQTG